MFGQNYDAEKWIKSEFVDRIYRINIRKCVGTVYLLYTQWLQKACEV
jgi:hypothetical protein